MRSHLDSWTKDGHSSDCNDCRRPCAMNTRILFCFQDLNRLTRQPYSPAYAALHIFTCKNLEEHLDMAWCH